MGTIEKKVKRLESNELEFLSDAANLVVITKLGDTGLKNVSAGIIEYTDEGQEIFNNAYDELETSYRKLILNN